jgi:phosphate transport system protein
MSEHTFRAFDRQLESLRHRVLEMGGVTEKAIAHAMQRLAVANDLMAHSVSAGDLHLDALRREIEEAAILVIAREQPVAVDLRECIAAIRVAGDLYRIGQRAKNIADRAADMPTEMLSPDMFVGLRSMHDVATKQFKAVLDAYARHDASQARSVWLGDAHLDALEDAFLRTLITFMMEDRGNITYCTQLLFCAKNLERIGDHATNIAEMVVWLVTGETMPIERPKHGIAKL